MNIVGLNIEANMFTLFAKKVGSLYDEHLRDMRSFIEEQQRLGVSNEEIFRRLEADMATDSGIYSRLNGTLAKEIQDSLNKTFQLSSNQLDEGTKVKWSLDPSAEHCESCLYQADRGALDISEFPIPGFQETHGDTNCEEYCKCTLTPVQNDN